LVPVCAQTSTDNLPAAPSATIEQEQQARAKAQAAARAAAEAAAAQQAKEDAAKAVAAKDAAAKDAASKHANGSASPAPKNDAQAPQKSSDHGVDGSLLDAGDGTPSSDTTITRRVNEVNWVFTVMDRHGRYVKDLKKEDFNVLDNNRPVNRIRSFQNETDLPLQVGLLIDASNSIRERFKFEQESAIEFLNDTIRRKYDKAFVIGFDVTPEVTQDFTDDAEALSQGIRVLRPGGGTALFDALYYACRDKLMKEPHSGPVRKAIILLTDGDDNQSHVTREEAIEMAQRAEVVVYTISTNLTDKGGEGDKILQRIADATGGRSYTPFQLTDVADAFGKIQDELRSQYALSFRPPELNPDGSFHVVQILAKNHKGLRVRGRLGYYAPNE
jgi:VWFA-related protein